MGAGEEETTSRTRDNSPLQRSRSDGTRLGVGASVGTNACLNTSSILFSEKQANWRGSAVTVGDMLMTGATEVMAEVKEVGFPTRGATIAPDCPLVSMSSCRYRRKE